MIIYIGRYFYNKHVLLLIVWIKLLLCKQIFEMTKKGKYFKTPTVTRVFFSIFRFQTSIIKSTFLTAPSFNINFKNSWSTITLEILCNYYYCNTWRSNCKGTYIIYINKLKIKQWLYKLISTIFIENEKCSVKLKCSGKLSYVVWFGPKL